MKILSRFFRKKKAKKTPWTDLFSVGRETYGEPKIKHWGEPATLVVGAFCSIAENVTIFLGGNHRTDWITTYPFPVFRDSAKGIEGHPATRGDVIIGNDVWLGYGSTVMSGVRIGNGAVIGAFAIVAKDVPAYAIVAGNPAKLLRYRFSNTEVALLESLAWWDWTDSKLDAAMPTLLASDLLALRAFSLEYDARAK